MTGPPSVHQAAKWSVLTGLIGQVGQVTVTVLLAAILGPERFGVVALATLYLLLISRLIRQGIGQAIVQRDDLRKSHLDSAFIMTMSTALLITVVTILIAPVLSLIFDAPGLTNLLRALAGLGVLRGLGQIPVALFERTLDFRLRAMVLNLGVIAGGVAGITSALLGAAEYALAYQLYAEASVALVLVYINSSWRPHLRFEWESAKELLPFSVAALLTTLGAFVAMRVDTIVVGAFFGPAAVGIYRLSSRVVDLVVNVSAGSLGPVSLASLSRVQRDDQKFADLTYKLMKMSTSFTAPLLAVVFVGSRVTVELFGSDWNGALPVLRILALAGIARVAVYHIGPILESRGRPYHAAGSVAISSCIAIGTFIPFALLFAGEPLDSVVKGMALSRLFADAVLIAPIFLIIIARFSALSVGRLIKSNIPAVLASGATIGIGMPLDMVVAQSGLNVVVQGAVVGTVAASVAVAAIMILDTSARQMVTLALSEVGWLSS